MTPAAIYTFFTTLRAANPSPQTELEYASVFELLAAVLLADHGEPRADTLDTLPAAVLTLLELNAQALKASLPSAESLSDISSLQG